MASLELKISSNLQSMIAQTPSAMSSDQLVVRYEVQVTYCCGTAESIGTYKTTLQAIQAVAGLMAGGGYSGLRLQRTADGKPCMECRPTTGPHGIEKIWIVGVIVQKRH